MRTAKINRAETVRITGCATGVAKRMEKAKARKNAKAEAPRGTQMKRTYSNGATLVSQIYQLDVNRIERSQQMAD